MFQGDAPRLFVRLCNLRGRGDAPASHFRGGRLSFDAETLLQNAVSVANDVGDCFGVDNAPNPAVNGLRV